MRIFKIQGFYFKKARLGFPLGSRAENVKTEIPTLPHEQINLSGGKDTKS